MPQFELAVTQAQERRTVGDNHHAAITPQFLHHAQQECRYLVKDFGTSQSPKSTRQRDSRYCPD
ncbi:MAG: hypothetical protein AB2813_03930, partial [Candidatus Sedimenticola endophacoides]